MTDEDISAIGQWFLQVIPLLNRHEPPGFIDFREGVPPDYRAGLFIKFMFAWNEPRHLDEPVKFKSKFGNCKTAVEAAASVSALIGGPVMVSCIPFAATLHTVTMFWDISFKVSEERLRILAAAGRINVHDVDRSSLVSESGEATQNTSVDQLEV